MGSGAKSDEKLAAAEHRVAQPGDVTRPRTSGPEYTASKGDGTVKSNDERSLLGGGAASREARMRAVPRLAPPTASHPVGVPPGKEIGGISAVPLPGVPGTGPPVSTKVGDNLNDPWLRVYGSVRDQYGDRMEGVIVQALDRDLRNEQLLGRVPARDGHYEIRYQRSQFRAAEKDSADLVVKVLDRQDKELYKTPIQYNAPPDFELNITLQGGFYQGPSEWELLTGGADAPA